MNIRQGAWKRKSWTVERQENEPGMVTQVCKPNTWGRGERIRSSSAAFATVSSRPAWAETSSHWKQKQPLLILLDTMKILKRKTGRHATALKGSSGNCSWQLPWIPMHVHIITLSMHMLTISPCISPHRLPADFLNFLFELPKDSNISLNRKVISATITMSKSSSR